MRSAFEDIMDRVKNPENNLTPENRQKIRNLSGNVENSLKASLVNLLMGQFSKISAYDDAASTAIRLLSERAQTMTDEDLISFLTTLAKVSSSESKNVMDLFKKHDTDLKQFLRGVQELMQAKPYYGEKSGEEVIDEPEDKTLKRLSSEKKEKLFKLLEKLDEDEEGSKTVEVSPDDNGNPKS